MEEFRTFSIMAKPVSSSCNLNCTYCYYLDKSIVNKQVGRVMSDEVLEAYIKQNLDAHGKLAEVEFAWHGGEPTIAPLSFYEKAVKLQKTYGASRRITNTIQTNATLLNDQWCSFFAENNFQLGVSIDGPKEIHNLYRGGNLGGSFDEVMESIRLLKNHNVKFNTLTTVNAVNWERSKEVYEFLREFTDYMQFLPVVESQAAGFEDAQRFATPPGIHSLQIKHPVLDFSVPRDGYGIFLGGILTEWQKNDIGKKYVQIFEATIGNLLKKPAGFCVHEALCGHCAVVEVTGDVYSCDRYAYPEYKLGNLMETSLKQLIEKNRPFGMNKIYGLPDECLDCEYIKLCFGGCPKDRILWSADGQKGKNYFCESYKMFYASFIREFGSALSADSTDNNI